MAGKLNLKPRKIYFLQLIDDSTNVVLPYVKVGITEGPVADRIASLQTASPFRFVEHDHFQSEAAELVEHHIHHTHADQRVRREWLRCEPDTLPALVASARAYNAEIDARAVEVRGYDAADSGPDMLAVTDEARRIHELVKPLYIEHLKANSMQQICKSRLAALVEQSAGIDGVVRVTITSPSAGFKASDLKRERPELYAQFLVKPSHRCAFKLLGMPTLKHFPELKAEVASAKSGVAKVDPSDVDATRMVGRTEEIETLHSRFLDLEVEKTLLEGEMLRHELALRQLCGLHAGIEDICSYKRETTLVFDAEALKQQHPDVHAAYVRTGQPTRRVTVLPSRGYA